MNFSFILQPGGLEKKTWLRIPIVNSNSFVESIKFTVGIVKNQYATRCRRVQFETLSHDSFSKCIHWNRPLLQICFARMLKDYLCTSMLFEVLFLWPQYHNLNVKSLFCNFYLTISYVSIHSKVSVMHL